MDKTHYRVCFGGGSSTIYCVWGLSQDVRMLWISGSIDRASTVWRVLAKNTGVVIQGVLSERCERDLERVVIQLTDLYFVTGDGSNLR